jgi:hypothetical protein
MNFQYTFPNYVMVKIFYGTCPPYTNAYFRGTVMYDQYGFLYLKLTRPKLTVLALIQMFNDDIHDGFLLFIFLFLHSLLYIYVAFD